MKKATKIYGQKLISNKYSGQIKKKNNKEKVKSPEI